MSALRPGTQLSNPRMASGAALHCPECGFYTHPADTKCSRELAARSTSHSARESVAGAGR